MVSESTGVLLFIVVAVAASVLSRKIDTVGGLSGGLITYGLFLAAGGLGVMLIGGFFVLGTLASVWKLRQKDALGLAETRNVRRGWRNVVANAGAAGLVAAAVVGHWLDTATGQILIAAAFASALSDTWSSELGNVYGRNFYHVLTGKRDQRGRDGVVSTEGSLAGLAGSGVMATLYGLFYGFDRAVIIISLAGILGNLTDSVLGATLERRGILNNHGVNFLSTAVAVLLAYFLVKY